MDIKNYTSFFHDGTIFDIVHAKNNVIISMESAEMGEEDLKDDATLTYNHRIRGRLHIEGVKTIKRKDEISSNLLKMEYEDAEIFRFKLNASKVELQIIWNCIPPSARIKDFSTVEIEAENIWWENMPDMITLKP